MLCFSLLWSQVWKCSSSGLGTRCDPQTFNLSPSKHFIPNSAHSPQSLSILLDRSQSEIHDLNLDFPGHCGFRDKSPVIPRFVSVWGKTPVSGGRGYLPPRLTPGGRKGRKQWSRSQSGSRLMWHVKHVEGGKSSVMEHAQVSDR